MSPKIPLSVVIPVHNREKLLNRAIESVRLQRNIDVCLIIVDDGSDKPVKKVKIGGAVKKVKLIRNENPLNAAVARNQGASKCDTEIIAFLDSDDYWTNDHLFNAVNELNSNLKASFYLGSYRHYKCSNYIESVSVTDPYVFQFETRGSFRSSCFVFRTKFFQKINGFNETLEKHQDWDLGLRVGTQKPFLWHIKKTVIIDGEAEGRMSYRPNIPASKNFLSIHGQRMSKNQRLEFLSGLVNASIRPGFKNQRSEIKKFVLEWSDPYKLKTRSIISWYLPYVLYMWNLIRRGIK